MVDADAREGASGSTATRRATFARWMPVTEERGGDAAAAPRGAEGCPYELAREDEDVGRGGT